MSHFIKKVLWLTIDVRYYWFVKCLWCRSQYWSSRAPSHYCRWFKNVQPSSTKLGAFDGVDKTWICLFVLVSSRAVAAASSICKASKVSDTVRGYRQSTDLATNDNYNLSHSISKNSLLLRRFTLKGMFPLVRY